MKRVPAAEHIVYEWPYQPTLEENQHSKHLNKENKPRRKEKKQTPEQMIHSLQGVFCGGRYRTWVFSREKPVTKTPLQLPAGGRS